LNGTDNGCFMLRCWRFRDNGSFDKTTYFANCLPGGASTPVMQIIASCMLVSKTSFLLYGVDKAVIEQ
jgi:hypothetical protein